MEVIFVISIMEEKPSIEEVLSAVSALYNNPEKSEKERASQWLLELQKSVRNLLVLFQCHNKVNFILGSCLDCS